MHVRSSFFTMSSSKALLAKLWATILEMLPNDPNLGLWLVASVFDGARILGHLKRRVSRACFFVCVCSLVFLVWWWWGLPAAPSHYTHGFGPILGRIHFSTHLRTSMSIFCEMSKNQTPRILEVRPLCSQKTLFWTYSPRWFLNWPSGEYSILMGSNRFGHVPSWSKPWSVADSKCFWRRSNSGTLNTIYCPYVFCVPLIILFDGVGDSMELQITMDIDLDTFWAGSIFAHITKHPYTEHPGNTRIVDILCDFLQFLKQNYGKYMLKNSVVLFCSILN